MEPRPALDTLVFFVPVGATEKVLQAVFDAGGGRIGTYADCAFVSPGTGQFRPLPGSSPSIGVIGELAKVEENRVELVLPRALREEVVAALLAAHPYEQPAWSIVESVHVVHAGAEGEAASS
jgi:hypothetical protein